MKLEILIGMIASGKSTYARHRADQGALIVSHDDLTTMLHGRYRYEADNRAMYLSMLVGLAHEALGRFKDVVVDRTHLTAKARAPWVEVARALYRHGTAVEPVAVVFPAGPPDAHADRRWLTDGRGRSLQEWADVARSHAADMARGRMTADSLRAEGFAEVVEVTAGQIAAWAAEPSPFPAYQPPRESEVKRG